MFCNKLTREQLERIVENIIKVQLNDFNDGFGARFYSRLGAWREGVRDTERKQDNHVIQLRDSLNLIAAHLGLEIVQVSENVVKTPAHIKLNKIKKSK